MLLLIDGFRLIDHKRLTNPTPQQNKILGLDVERKKTQPNNRKKAQLQQP